VKFKVVIVNSIVFWLAGITAATAETGCPGFVQMGHAWEAESQVGFVGEQHITEKPLVYECLGALIQSLPAEQEAVIFWEGTEQTLVSSQDPQWIDVRKFCEEQAVECHGWEDPEILQEMLKIDEYQKRHQFMKWISDNVGAGKPISLKVLDHYLHKDITGLAQRFEQELFAQIRASGGQPYGHFKNIAAQVAEGFLRVYRIRSEPVPLPLILDAMFSEYEDVYAKLRQKMPSLPTLTATGYHALNEIGFFAYTNGAGGEARSQAALKYVEDITRRGKVALVSSGAMHTIDFLKAASQKPFVGKATGFMTQSLFSQLQVAEKMLGKLPGDRRVPELVDPETCRLS
jgi:hypothetical protein